MKRLSMYAGLLILSIATFTSCKNDTTPNPSMMQVTMDNDRFNPETITVSPGTTVMWVNKEDDIHTVTSDDFRKFNSGDLSENQTFTYKFSTAGTYHYHCIHHVSEGMVGTVIVR